MSFNTRDVAKHSTTHRTTTLDQSANNVRLKNPDLNHLNKDIKYKWLKYAN